MQLPSTKYQYLSALVVSLIGIEYGIMTGWASEAVRKLQLNETVILEDEGPITIEQASWIVSLKSLTFVLNIPIFGVIANKFGRKWPLNFLAIPLMISWVLIYFAKNIYYIYVARFLHGMVTAGVYSLSQFYFVEISHDSIRGMLGATVLVTGTVGNVIAYVLGAYFNYYISPIFAGALAAVYGIVFLAFPETPLYLLKQNEIKKAEQSIRFYQNIHGSDNGNLVKAEIEKLENLIGAKTGDAAKRSVKWEDITSNPGRKALIIGVVLAISGHISGSFAIINYTGSIFEKSGSEDFLSAKESAIVVGIVQLVGVVIMLSLVERLGRKILYIISMLGSILGYATFGLYLLFKEWNYDVGAITWIPLVSLSFVILVQSFAVSTLALSVIAELMPENLREFGVSFCNAILGTSSFIVLKSFLFAMETIGVHGTMFTFAGILVPCLMFIGFYVPETKGKSYNEIMTLLK